MSKKASKEYVPVVPSPDQRYLTVKNAAAFLQVAVSYVRHELVYAKAVPCVRAGNRIIFDRDDLIAYMQKKKANA